MDGYLFNRFYLKISFPTERLALDICNLETELTSKVLRVFEAQLPRANVVPVSQVSGSIPGFNQMLRICK